MCGEYGTEDERPHYHACLFGHDWEDKEYWATTGSGEKLYRSKQLEKLWTQGISSTAEVTFESAAYVARYCMKKVGGFNQADHYKRSDNLGEYQLVPEFGQMSLKPGIGAEWFRKFKNDIYPHDYVVVNAQQCRPPKYYDQLYERENPDALEDIKQNRIMEAMSRWQDNTPERLATKQVVTEAKLKFLKRS